MFSDSPLVPQQRVQLGSRPAKRLERFHGRPAAAGLQDRAPVFSTGGQVWASPVGGRFLERGERVGCEHLGPLVAVVARSVPAGKDVLKLCANRLNGGGWMTATSARTAASIAAMPSRSSDAALCILHVEQGELDLPHRLQPAWKVREACSFSNSSLRGSGSPESTWAEISGSTSVAHAKFSMNWLGSSTASHATPLMPAMLGKSTRVSM
jgi:hypothetical protein